MPSTSKNVLFLGHDASRTGAPLLLLELLKWLCANSDIKPAVLLKRAGPIEPLYRAVVADTSRCDEFQPKVSFALHHRILRRLRLEKIRQPDLNQVFPVTEYPVVYANTIDTLDLARQLAAPSRRCILHVHELAYTVCCFQAEQALRDSARFVTTFVAASSAVRDYLVRHIGLPAERITVVHEFPISYLKVDTELAAARIEVRRSIGVADGTMVIGMCGTMDWRKGIDLFLQLAIRLRMTLGRPFLCVWVGGDPADPKVRHDIVAAGLEKLVHIEPPSQNPERYYPAFDLFTLTSREDPFPVAMLEAAASSIPVVAFHGGGGAPEFVEDDGGRLVPYMDTAALAEAIGELAASPESLRRLGVRAREKVNERYLLDLQAPKLVSIINRHLPAMAR